jgi:hypothetical protein
MNPSLLRYALSTKLGNPQHQAFWSAVELMLTPAQRQQLEEGGQIRNSIWLKPTPPSGPVAAPASPVTPATVMSRDPSLENLQSWLTYLTSPQVQQESRERIRPLTPAEACGFIGCIIIETGRPNLDRLDVVEAGSGAGRGAMQYTAVRRIAYDKARSTALNSGIDPNSNRWQQQYFAEEYAGLHDPSQGSLIGWTRIFENRPPNMTPAQAAEYWTGSAASRTGYFRPGVPHLDRRQAEAQRVWGLVQSGRLLAPQQRPPLQQQGAPVPAGMVGPKKQPPLKPGDHHLLADDRLKTLTAYTHDGKRLWSVPCLCRGQAGESEWTVTNSDTPPGLYLVGQVYRDYEQDPSATFSADRRAYGWYSFDLLGQEGQEGPGSRYGRDGIMIHGGGTACGWPGAWAPRQALHPTLGCIRMHNVDLRDRVLPLLGMGRIWVSVMQEAAS